MELTVKHFRDLSCDELLDLLKLRVAVFVVEQNCAYQEVDEADRSAIHLWLREGDEIVACARVLPAGAAFEEVAIGRVIAAKRRCGLGSRIVAEAIGAAKEQFGAKRIVLEAQVYAKALYEKLGFCVTSEEFLEDGIPHILMTLEVE